MTHEQVVTGTAWGALLSPLWLPTLHDISAAAAWAAPILGSVWLLIQITSRLWEIYSAWRKRRRK